MPVNSVRNTYTTAGDAGDHANSATFSDPDIVGQATVQGIKVAEIEQNNPNFDVTQYAQSIVPYLQSLGLSDSQVNTYLSTMVAEFNYLTPTPKLDPQNSNVGSDILNQVLPNASEPGQAEDPATTSAQTLVNQGTVLGQQLAAVQNNNWSNFDISTYAQNVGNQMLQAGYNSQQVYAFTSGVMMGYASALGGYLNQ